MATDEKTMFEIYRETGYNRTFRYIFYTDLEEHGRDNEITRAMSGESLFTGYLVDESKEQARGVVEAIVDELNDMDEDEASMPSVEIKRRLDLYLAPAP